MIEILQETKTSVVCVKPVGIAAQGMDAQALPQSVIAGIGSAGVVAGSPGASTAN